MTLVNIVGTIDLEQLRALQGKFGDPDLKMEDAGSKASTPKPASKAKP